MVKKAVDRKFEPVYPVRKVAEVLDVDKETVYKFLSCKENDGGVIPRSDWFRLPNGHIRIRARAVRRLLGP